ncbi:unnamed protein product [Taenia asiatica]|uniref:BTB domain-containing protein n=1 Tax=Taenia asiatica TaxID=60517 RepID=A0A0R3WBF1_TAEAS|nr:unnamed protein product [Taenia asiatica]
MTSGQDELAIQWKGFSYDVVDAIVNYAYTGKIIISTGNATQLCLLAHNLGCEGLGSSCVEFLRTRLSQENVAEVWSLANVTMNRELIELCIPLMSRHLGDLCWPQEPLVQTTVEQFDTLLEDRRLKNVSEETKFRAISKWLKAGTTLPSLRMQPKVKVIKQQLWALPSSPLLDKYMRHLSHRRDHLYNNPNSRFYECPDSVEFDTRGAIDPQLECSFNILHFVIAATVATGQIVQYNNSFPWRGKESSLMFVNCQNGSIFYKSFNTSDREYYAVASKNESIFIFGGYLYKQCLATCEKLDTSNGEIIQLPHMPSARRDASALTIPDVGILVVGGLHQASGSLTKSNNAELLVQDPKNASGWRWVQLQPMLQARRSPGIAYFRGCAVVVGGDDGLTAECLPLPSIGQTEIRWTRLHRCDKQYSTATSLVTFNERLILLLSDYTGADVHEFLPVEGDQSLATFEWKPLFRLDDLESPRLFVAREELDES